MSTDISKDISLPGRDLLADEIGQKYISENIYEELSRARARSASDDPFSAGQDE